MSAQSVEINCSVCRGSAKLFYPLKRLGRSVYRCSGCGFKWTVPPLHYDSSESDPYYVSPPYTRNLESDKKKAQTHLTNITKAVDLSSAPEKSLIEIGCSNGSLLSLFAASGFLVEGLEISRPELEECKRKGLNVHAVTLEDFKSEQQFGVMVSVHVIEHLRDVHQYFATANNLLVTGGLNIFLTPNGGSALFSIFRRFWTPATPDEHNLFLNLKAVSILAEKHGFEVVTISNTGRYFSALRGILSEIYRVRQRISARPSATTDSSIAVHGTRKKRDAILKVIGYIERPFLSPIHYLLTRLGRSDELLCVLKKKR